MFNRRPPDSAFCITEAELQDRSHEIMRQVQDQLCPHAMHSKRSGTINAEWRAGNSVESLRLSATVHTTKDARYLEFCLSRATVTIYETFLGPVPQIYGCSTPIVKWQYGQWLKDAEAIQTKQWNGQKPLSNVPAQDLAATIIQVLKPKVATSRL